MDAAKVYRRDLEMKDALKGASQIQLFLETLGKRMLELEAKCEEVASLKRTVGELTLAVGRFQVENDELRTQITEANEKLDKCRDYLRKKVPETV